MNGSRRKGEFSRTSGRLWAGARGELELKLGAALQTQGVGHAGSQLEDEGGLRWFFLTTPSVHELLPLVEGFGQDVQYSVDRSTGRPVRQLSHVLKVFLIDRSGYVREIYTSTFLHPRAIIGDIKTLLME